MPAPRSPALALALAFLALAAAPAAAQLRPLNPVDWSVLEDGAAVVARAGLGVHRGQRASLAGTEGELLEVGNFEALWRSGRFALELGGTVLRLFEDQSAFASPSGGADPDGPDRRDSGDYRVGTVIRLTPADLGALAILRFGTRLPTTDNTVGLDRDRTDFYALLGASARRGPARIGAEAGIGIFGSHDLRYEQNDVLLYMLTAEYALPLLTPHVALVGHRGGFDGWVPRGNEDLAELRLGLRTRGRVRAEAAWVRGLSEFSPTGGVLVGIALRR